MSENIAQNQTCAVISSLLYFLWTALQEFLQLTTRAQRKVFFLQIDIRSNSKGERIPCSSCDWAPVVLHCSWVLILGRRHVIGMWKLAFSMTHSHKNRVVHRCFRRFQSSSVVLISTNWWATFPPKNGIFGSYPKKFPACIADAKVRRQIERVVPVPKLFPHMFSWWSAITGEHSKNQATEIEYLERLLFISACSILNAFKYAQ